MWTRQFWADLLERSVRAAAWALLATKLAAATGTLTGVDWLGALNVAGYAFLLAGVVSLAGSRLGAKDSASLLPTKLDPPKPRKRRDSGSVVVTLLVVLLVAFALAALLGIR